VNPRIAIILAGAALALAVPAVSSATTKHQRTAHHPKLATVKKSSKAAKRTKSVGPLVPARPPIYIDIPGTYVSPTADPNACQDSGNNCTALGACAYWSLGCDSLSADDQAALQEDNLTPGDTTSSVDSASDQPGSTSDVLSSTVDPSASADDSSSQASTVDQSSDSSTGADPTAQDSNDDC
jgi:hypothetical protein